MMNEKVLAKAVQQYLQDHQHTDANRIALAKSPFDGISSSELAGQILAKKKAEKKLPTWFKRKGIYFPSPLSIEQTSSETTAAYKRKLVKGNTLIDITGGFGVDCHYFAKQLKSVTHCEINSELSEIASYNAKILEVENICFKNIDGISYLKSGSTGFDTVYADPARRAEKGKVFMLKDCTPNITTNLDALLLKSNRIIIKTAPLLDLSAGLSELKHVSEIHILSIKNECKELLWVIDNGFEGYPTIIATTLNEKEKTFIVDEQHINSPSNFSSELVAGNYLYEPDAALLKSGAFNYIGQFYQLQKLHPQTQLYSSKEIVTEFAGRIFMIKEVLTTSALKKRKDLSGNVIVRNYPARAEELGKKYKIKSADDEFIIFTKALNNDNLVLLVSIEQYY